MKTLEEKRKARAKEYYKQKLQLKVIAKHPGLDHLLICEFLLCTEFKEESRGEE